ncbi:hypothetical protein L3X38_036583 [Prunus dulcis]|uniref:Uncharacterized protein n=1 Tax=Prunus dulcis TaxID=3755 RepID=A0AAD4V3L2_PRUDU|nr:hypothetical protein L3X38_036583 [Prunus dulcis]
MATSLTNLVFSTSTPNSTSTSSSHLQQTHTQWISGSHQQDLQEDTEEKARSSQRWMARDIAKNTMGHQHLLLKIYRRNTIFSCLQYRICCAYRNQRADPIKASYEP